MLMGLIVGTHISREIDKFTPYNHEFLVPNKHAGRSFSAQLINVQFLISRVLRQEKSQKLIRCAA